jgi:hypothetical protein
MRVQLDCATCGPVAIKPADAAVVTDTGETDEVLFECPVCTRVRAAELGRAGRVVLLARGAAVVHDGAADEDAPLGLLDLMRLQQDLEAEVDVSELLDETG